MMTEKYLSKNISYKNKKELLSEPYTRGTCAKFPENFGATNFIRLLKPRLNLPLRTVCPIYRTCVPLLSRCFAFYIFFLTNISTEYFKHAAHSPFFSSKCRLFHNATLFLVPVLFIFYIQGVLKIKCKTPVPKS
jgi:hypothetical protein